MEKMYIAYHLSSRLWEGLDLNGLVQNHSSCIGYFAECLHRVSEELV